MFTVNEYKILFNHRWHLRTSDYGNGRYDTVCEIYTQCTTTLTKRIIYREKPSFTGVAKLHPNDQVDKLVGKKVALLNAMITGYRVDRVSGQKKPDYHLEFYIKSKRTAIWKAFWQWVASWPNQTAS